MYMFTSDSKITVVHDFFGLLLTKHFEIEYAVLSPGSLEVDGIFLFKFDRRN